MFLLLVINQQSVSGAIVAGSWNCLPEVSPSSHYHDPNCSRDLRVLFSLEDPAFFFFLNSLNVRVSGQVDAMLSVSTGTSVAICCYHSVAVGWWSCTAQWRLVHCSEGGFAAVNLHADPVMSPAWAPACQVLLAHSRLVFLRALFQDTVAKALGGFPVSTKSILPHVTFLWVLSGTWIETASC